MRTPKNSDFDTLRVPKNIKFGVIFDANLIEFEDDWDKQCTEIIVFFSQYVMLFQQFCFSVVGEYG